MGTAQVKNGIDLIANYADLFKRKRVGLITSPTGLTREFKSSIDVFHESFELVALYSPEHGVRGNLQAGVIVDTYVDEKTGIMVYSLYGKNKKPSAEVLLPIDIMVMDVQDVGSRYYTFLSTMAYTMEACAEFNKPFVILDRPNPLGGVKVEGNILDPAYKSFVGAYPIPIRHGLTIGELAVFLNREFTLKCDLQVVKMQGWKREIFFNDTDLFWVNPSPNIPTFKTSLLYNGTCLFEGTNISEGRGTTKPFEMIGAPWLDGDELAGLMNAKKLPGVIFRSVCFEPTFSKHQGKLCFGVQIHVTDKRALNAVTIGLELLDEVIRMSKDSFEWLPPFKGRNYFIDHLAGTDDIRMRRYSASEFTEKWDEDRRGYENIKSQYHLY